MIWLPLFAIAGLLVSSYVLYIHKKLKKDKHFKPVCDISDKISCSKAVKSEYADLVYFPNAVWGILFYLLVFVLVFFREYNFVFYLAVLANIASIGLAYISFFIQRNMCVLCTATYVINFLILFASFWRV